jgi:hypothetical protein
MATKQVTLPDIGKVTLYKRRGNRSLKLTIGANGEVRVSLPYWLPYRAGEQFAVSKSAWIADNMALNSVIVRHGQSIGKAHRLCFEPLLTAKTITTQVRDNEIRVQYPSYYRPSDRSVQNSAHRACIRALRKEAATLLPMRLAALANQIGLTYTGVQVKRLKSRWGSCNTDKEITLNIFLMQLPWSLIDYVLIHELVHTQVMRHGSPFWAKMDSYLPQSKQLRKQIGRYQPRLLPITRNVVA